MNSTRHIERDDLVLFAMQLLPPNEAESAAAHIENCPECRRELAEVQGDLAVYAHTVDLQTPLPQARERLMQQVAQEKKSVPVPMHARPEEEELHLPTRGSGGRSFLTEDDLPRRSFAGKVFPWLGWALAAGLAVTSGNLYLQRESMRGSVAEQNTQIAQLSNDTATAQQIMDTMTDPSAMRVTLTKTPATPVSQGRATYVANKGMLIFQANNMEPLQPSKVYELWLIPANGNDPIPAGTFHPDERGNASVMMPPLPKGVEAKAFGVTVENEGGSQKPTLPIIMAGA
jgi:hypothetical protein